MTTAFSETERRAIGALARHVSAPWANGQDPLSATITVAGERVAVAVANVAGDVSHGKGKAKARLRNDRVARRFLSDLEAAVEARARSGRTVILTLSAPIKLPKQTLAVLTETLLHGLTSGTTNIEETVVILGNRMRFTVLDDGSRWTSKAVGFVFSGDVSPGDLADAMRSLDEAITAKARTCAPAGHWWLVLACDDRVADIETYRRALSRRSIPHRFEKILMVSDRGHIETLVDGGWSASR